MTKRLTDDELREWRDGRFYLFNDAQCSVTAMELLALRARVATLEALHRELAQICWEGGSLDGGELQDMLIKHDILVEVMVEKPCSERCNCEDNDAVFPTTCYRLKDAPQ